MATTVGRGRELLPGEPSAKVRRTPFVAVERRKERKAGDPLIELTALRHPRFRYGLLTTAILSMGQLGIMIVLSVFLQSAVRLSAVRAGVVLQITGMAWIVLVLAPDLTFWRLLPGLVVYGLGIGTSSAQLTNVILSDVDPARSGVASGTTSTVRQVGAAVGIACVSTILTVQAMSATMANFRSADISAEARDRAQVELERAGTSFDVPPATDHRDGEVLLGALADGIVDAARPALLFGLVVTSVGLAVSALMPRGAPTAVSKRDRSASGRIADGAS